MTLLTTPQRISITQELSEKGLFISRVTCYVSRLMFSFSEVSSVSEKFRHLSVLDQSPVREGGTAAEALRDTIALAEATEKLGYKRFWVAEHHSLPGFAGTSPEIMVGQIAARTKTIRVGSGGVMLSHYSAFKVAEVFRMLDSFYPAD